MEVIVLQKTITLSANEPCAKFENDVSLPSL